MGKTLADSNDVTAHSRYSASLTTWTTQLSTLEKRAAEHDRYAAELLGQISEPLKNIALKYEDMRKSHADFATKLESERDASYGELILLIHITQLLTVEAALKRTKGKYDGVCQEVESRRKKIESSFDSRYFDLALGRKGHLITKFNQLPIASRKLKMRISNKSWICTMSR